MASDLDILNEATRLLRKGTRLALCTVVEKKGSGPREVGAKMIVTEDGVTYGTIGGGNFERALISECMKAIREHKSRTVTFNMTAGKKEGEIETGLICGGELTVLVDVMEPDSRLVIVGSGHVALPLAKLAEIAGFRIVIVDEDNKAANKERFPMAEKIITGDLSKALRDLDVGSNDFIVIAHGEPEHDYVALKEAIEKKPVYVGLLGSQTKVATLVQRLRKQGISEKQLNVLHAPLGLDIGAQTPGEIGVSAVAEIIKCKRKLCT
jgi:xanthine dehydrogenase accessory factor